MLGELLKQEDKVSPKRLAHLLQNIDQWLFTPLSPMEDSQVIHMTPLHVVSFAWLLIMPSDLHTFYLGNVFIFIHGVRF